ncbi:MAG: glutamate racemase [Azospirillaceae bacterium]
MARIIVFDSGVGGRSVAHAIERCLPEVAINLVTDREGFPYGDWEAAALKDRVVRVVGQALDRIPADAVVIACNTATTVALDALRAAYAVPFIGTVPGIKPAVAATRTGVIGLLATGGTIGRTYTADLISRFAGQVTVVPVGSRNLAAIAEAKLAGAPVDRAAVMAEIAPLFQRAGPPVDTVVLGCTHYPLLLRELQGAAMALGAGTITWIDTGPAIAAQVARVLARVLEESASGQVSR